MEICYSFIDVVISSHSARGCNYSRAYGTALHLIAVLAQLKCYQKEMTSVDRVPTLILLMIEALLAVIIMTEHVYC